MDARNCKYISAWKGKYTKWDYKLEIILPPIGYSFGLPLSSPTEVALPIGAVRLNKMTINYKDYTISLPEAPTATIDVDFNILSSSVYDDFRNAFMEDSPIMSVVQNPLTKSLAVNNVRSGVIFNLYIKFNGNDENSPAPYRLVRTYIHQADGKITLNARNKVIRVEPIDINRVIVSAFPWTSLEEYSAISREETDYYEDLVWSEGATVKTVQNAFIRDEEYESIFAFGTYEEIEEVLADTGAEIKKMLMRDESQSFDLTTYIPTLYKQLYDGTGDKGEELNRSNIYLLTQVYQLDEETHEPILVDGLFYSADKYSLNGRYPNGGWDYLSELGEFGMRQYRVGPSGIISGFNTFSNVTLDLNLTNVKSLEIKSEQYKTITSSCYEIRSDEATGGDVDKIEEVNPGGRNEASWTIPIVFNNTPPNVKGIEFNSNLKYYYKPRICNFYYKESDTFIRCHEWAKFVLAYDETGNKTSDDFNSFYAVPRTGGIFGFKHSDRIALVCQTQSGVPMILAKTMKSLLGGGLDKLDFEININEHVNFVEGGGGNGFIWNFPEGSEASFSVNIAEIFGITYSKDNWKMLTSEIDIVEERALVRLINLNV